MAESGMFNNWENVVSPVRNDLVFENRNKDYGAYVIRRQYSNTLSIVLCGVAGVLVLSWLTWFIINHLPKVAVEAPPPIDMSQVDMTPPPVDEATPPPPPPPPPPPVMETVKFTPPVVTDEEVKDEDIPPPQDKLSETNVSTETQEGTGGDDIVVPTEGGNGNGPIEEKAPEIFTIVEEMPEPPGGVQAFYSYVAKNVQYPQMAKEAGIGGKCFLKFVVNEDGDISDVTILKGVPGCPECDKEAVRVVKNSPKWKAGKQNGRAVKVWYNFFVNFTLK